MYSCPLVLRRMAPGASGRSRTKDDRAESSPASVGGKGGRVSCTDGETVADSGNAEVEATG